MFKRLKKLTCLLLCFALLFACTEGINIRSSAITASQQEYLETIGAAASEDMVTSGIMASLTVAQSILEAGWGTSTMAKVAKNLFGIKAHAGWKGMVYDGKAGIVYPSYSAYADANTPEYVKENAQRIWRAYSSWTESFADHSNLLTSASRYDNLPFEYDYVNVAWNIIEDGYATDMEYIKKLISCIEIYDLSQYDVIEYPADQVVVVTKTRKYLTLNEQWQLPVSVIQPFGAEDAYTFASNDTSVATVDETGMITAHTEGDCLITVTSSTGWHACCYIAVYDPEVAHAEYLCNSDFPLYVEPDLNGESYGTLPSRHCVVGIGDKFTDENGTEWMKVRAKALTSTEVLLRTGYVLASDLTFVQDISFTHLTDVATITLDKTELTVEQYRTEKVTATVLNAEGKKPSSPTVRWVSDNPQVATVMNGKIKGVSEGECTVYAVSTDGVYTSCKVTVTPGVYVPVESLELSQTELTLNVNDIHTLTATINPENATDTEIEWSSSNDLVAKVIRGKVTAVGEGECTITAKIGDKTATCKVTVVKWVYTGIKYDGVVTGNNVNLRQGPDTSYSSLGFVNEGDTLSVYGDPTGNWYQVMVTSGNCQGIEGYIYASYVNIVKEQVESLVFNTTDPVLTKGDTIQLSWTVSPSESTVTFESSDTSIATVDANGLVTTYKAGEVTVTAKAEELTATLKITVTESGFTGTKYIGKVTTNGGSLNVRKGPDTDFDSLGKFPNGASITVYGDDQNGWYAVSGKLSDGTDVNGFVSSKWVTLYGKYADSLALETDHATITEGETYTLSWTVDPADVEVTFTVSDSSIATVDKNGVITAHGVGNVTVTVYAGGKTALFTLNALAKPEPALPENLLPKDGISVAGGYIHGVKERTTAEELLAMFENESKYIEIKLSGDKYAGTGTTVSLKDKDGKVIETATVIVLGDCDGTGTVSATDYLIVRRIVLLTYDYNDAQYEAACVSGRASVSATDYLMVRRHFLGLFDIYTQTSTNE